MKLRRQTRELVDEAVIDQQRRLLAEKDSRILALEVELEATRALVNVDRGALVQTYMQLARVYRRKAEFRLSQLHLALEIIEARRLTDRSP